MKTLGTHCKLILFGILLLAQQSIWADGSGQFEKIHLDELKDKIKGGWAGQMVGVSFGFPTEFGYRERIIPNDELPVWKPEMISEALQQDDLYVDITFAQVLDQKGLDASTDDFGAMFREAKYPLWHANLSARRALRRGVPATLSGTPQYNLHFQDIDFQIESDFIGLMSPGLPVASNELSFRAGRVINHADGIYGGMFISAMYGAAFFEEDPEQIVRNGLAVLPATSDYAQLIKDVLQWQQQTPTDWQSVWQKIHEKWNQGEMCPEGSLEVFNIDAKINGAYVALGLLYGGSNFERTMVIATRAGQDSDCNPSSALGILGVMKGYKNIPVNFTKGIDDIANEKFLYTDYSFNKIVSSTFERAIALIKQNGGYVKEDNAYVARQEPLAAEKQQWQGSGRVKEQLMFDNARWHWQGKWQEKTMQIWRYKHRTKISSTADAQASISFTGTGAALTGILLPDGGLAEIYLDGKFNRTIDVYPDEASAKPKESLWHQFGLTNGDHTLRIVVLGEPHAESTGSEISISSLIVYH